MQLHNLDIPTLLFIAVGLAMDAFAVSVASGFAWGRPRIGRALRMAFFFGAFQALMPLLGWFAGYSLRAYIEAVDHWIAFGLLTLIGGKMIYESRKIEEVEEEIQSASREEDGEGITSLLVLAVATSIDALAVGFSFSALRIAIIHPAVVIGIVTFLLSIAGAYLGSRFGHLFEKHLEALGGLILIGIGVKILVEHIVQHI